MLRSDLSLDNPIIQQIKKRIEDSERRSQRPYSEFETDRAF